jgi:DNA-binding CsgD family transcriptional regulator
VTSLLHEILEGEPLTDRETEILEGVAEGETAVQTGKRLYLSSETVKDYRKPVIAKLGARNPPHAAAAAIRRGLLPGPQTTSRSPVPVAVTGRSHQSARGH